MIYGSRSSLFLASVATVASPVQGLRLAPGPGGDVTRGASIRSANYKGQGQADQAPKFGGQGLDSDIKFIEHGDVVGNVGAVLRWTNSKYCTKTIVYLNAYSEGAAGTPCGMYRNLTLNGGKQLKKYGFNSSGYFGGGTTSIAGFIKNAGWNMSDTVTIKEPLTLGEQGTLPNVVCLPGKCVQADQYHVDLVGKNNAWTEEGWPNHTVRCIPENAWPHNATLYEDSNDSRKRWAQVSKITVTFDRLIVPKTAQFLPASDAAKVKCPAGGEAVVFDADDWDQLRTLLRNGVDAGSRKAHVDGNDEHSITWHFKAKEVAAQ